MVHTPFAGAVKVCVRKLQVPTLDGAAWAVPAWVPLTITLRLPWGRAKLSTQYDMVTWAPPGNVTVCCQIVRFGSTDPLTIM